MPDVEKVVNALEWLLENMVDPFNDFMLFDYDGPIVLANKPIIEDALALLKAQEPVLAIKLQSKKYIGRTGIAYDGSCGNCNGYLMRAWKSCPLCGKAVKW